MNETFSSTSSDGALALGEGTLARILELDAVGVYVKFVDRLESFDPRIASVTTTVRPDDPSHRTFELVRGPAEGSAHALASYGEKIFRALFSGPPVALQIENAPPN